MKKISVPDLIVDKYEPKDVVHFLSQCIDAVTLATGKHLQDQNMYGIVASLSSIGEIQQIAKKLDVKMNGQKKINIVQ